MKAKIWTNGCSWKPATTLTGALALAGLLFSAVAVMAQISPGTNSQPWLDFWSFSDTNTWTSDLGFAPLSYTNLSVSDLGDGTAVVVDNTNGGPAGLQYAVYENEVTNTVTNLTVAQGSVTLWFAPTSWASSSTNGTGPGDWGRLLQVGALTTNSSYGWWSLYLSTNGNTLYFSTQTNDNSGNYYTFLTAPISWTTDRWHFIALTYSASNTALYLDGVLATNGPPLTVYPGQDVLSNGFYIGSDYTGMEQAHGMFDDLATYNYPLSASTIGGTFSYQEFAYYTNPENMANIASAPSAPSTNIDTPDVITGPGNLQLVGATTAITSTNVWITNVVATPAGNGTMDLTFTIQGGSDGVPYDTFVNSVLDFSSSTNHPWAWMGQGYHGNEYEITNLDDAYCYLILGTPQDSDGDGLTDAYELLVSKTNPNNPDSNLDGISDGWDVLLGLDPHLNNVNTPSERANYYYTLADWLDEVSGVKNGDVILDAEGNVKQVSQ